MGEWPMVSLETLAVQEKSAISKPYGSAILKEDYRDSGIPVIRGVNLSRGIFHDDDFVFIDDNLADRMPGAQMTSGDLVITHRGTVGQVSMVPRKARYSVYVASTSHVKVRLDSAIAVPEFYYYWFASPLGRASILENVSTVGVPGLVQPVATVKRLKVPQPEPSEQRAIAEVLGALDDKIAANDEVIARSQELAALTWLRATRAQGSDFVPLSSLARFVNGRAYTKGATGTGRVVIRIAELNSGIGGATVYNDIEVPDDNVARPGDLLFAWSGSLTVARWHRPEGIINQHIFKVVPVESRPQWLVEHALRDKLAEFQAVAADKATTMGHIQRRHLDEPVLIPGHAEAGLIAPQMEALTDQVASLESENLVLARTRDQLLPLLMSGKVTVKDAEDEVGGLV